MPIEPVSTGEECFFKKKDRPEEVRAKEEHLSKPCPKRKKQL
jgi:hypothetical protein